MKSIVLLSTFLVVVGGISLATAQVPDTAPPSIEIPAGPLLKSAPEFSKWTVSYLYPKNPKSNSAPLSGDETHEMTVTKTGNIISEDIVDGRGCHSQTWHFGALQYRKPAGKSDWFESSPTPGVNVGSSEYSPLPQNGYRSWEWIGKDSYAGRATTEDGECLVFVPGGPRKVDLSNSSRTKEQLAALPMVAYVSAETRLPLTLRSGNVIQKIVFASPPSAMLELPPDLTEQIRKGEEARQRLYQPAARPF